MNPKLALITYNTNKNINILQTYTKSIPTSIPLFLLINPSNIAVVASPNFAGPIIENAALPTANNKTSIIDNAYGFK